MTPGPTIPVGPGVCKRPIPCITVPNVGAVPVVPADPEKLGVQFRRPRRRPGRPVPELCGGPATPGSRLETIPAGRAPAPGPELPPAEADTGQTTGQFQRAGGDLIEEPAVVGDHQDRAAILPQCGFRSYPRGLVLADADKCQAGARQRRHRWQDRPNCCDPVGVAPMQLANGLPVAHRWSTSAHVATVYGSSSRISIRPVTVNGLGELPPPLYPRCAGQEPCCLRIRTICPVW